MRRQFILAVLVAAALATGACATLQDPPNAPAPLPLMEQAGTPGVAHSSVITAAGPLTRAQGPVGAGETLVSFPFRYRHTAVLTEDVVGYSITVGGVQAPAGSPGYYAGTFAGGGPYTPNALAELWCFLPGVVGGERQHLCFLRNQPGIAAIAPTRMNPWLWTQFAPATGTFDYVRTPIYERRAVEIPGDLKLEYRFRGWSPDEARLTEFAVGREVREFTLRREADGRAVLRTVAGDLVLAPAPDAPAKAVVSLR
jgi:hypothetical protein